MQLSNSIEFMLYFAAIPVSVYLSKEDISSRRIDRNIIHFSIFSALILRSVWTAVNWSYVNVFEAIAAPITILLLWAIQRQFNGKKLGTGDIKYMLFMAFVLMTRQAITGILIAALLAILAWMIFRPIRDRDRGIPFIPFLFAGGFLSVFITPLYFRLLGTILRL
jgi:prepilin signal peptidase PulO-like enzyme (type II secretory pathway)